MNRSVQGGYDLCSRFVRHAEPSPRRRRRQTTNSPCRDQTPVNRAVPAPSSTSWKQVTILRAAAEQTRPRQREQRRSPRQGRDPHGRSVQRTAHLPFLGKRNRGTTSLPRCDKAPVDNTASRLSNSSFKQAPVLRAAREQSRTRLREQRRSPQPGYDLRSRFVLCTAHHPSARKRRVSMPQRCVSDKHPGHSGSAAVRLWPWLKQNGRLALRFLAKVSLFSTHLLKHKGTICLHG